MKPTIETIDVSARLHEQLLKSPVYVQKLKTRTVLVSILTIALIVFNVFYFLSAKEKWNEDQIFETQYANFGSNLTM